MLCVVTVQLVWCIMRKPSRPNKTTLRITAVFVGRSEEQYRQMWAEFERFVRSHSDTSPMHQKVLECLVECKKLPSDVAKASSSSELKDQTDKETDR